MSENSRRSFIRHATLGTAALGATVLVPAALGQEASARTRTAATQGAVQQGAMHHGPLMAYVKNANTGEIAVMVGEREVLHRDPQLAAQLGRIAAVPAKS
ncbi:twin-arginine translocation signal domain-containing protein [Streptacidiphilus sp. P02-A3a]|uniref:twin-arginine translocation signal domain-containing protein n=1 Tax=Streptacidiphilus sp. P02-A3a TaxID=2704468 RepID=UPI0015FDDF82|nr:twin-arginine translocation signal domain-containing protein [Streptacidiphilus sp. P02-A3a]QMU69378.1 twin-arginine translocation signal domain-containing protein [Streptacidiphilus sp. P02-A3a]